MGVDTRSFSSIIDGDTALASHLNTDLDKLYSRLNGKSGGDQMASSTLPDSVMQKEGSVQTYLYELFDGAGHEESGLGVTSSALIYTVATGVAYVPDDSNNKLVRVSLVNAITNSVTASRDTYLDLSKTGTVTGVAVVNGADAPSVTADSLRISKAISSALGISSVVDLGGNNLKTSVGHQIHGGLLSYSTSQVVGIDVGECDIGTARVSWTADQTLNRDTATYLGGAKAASQVEYVVVRDDGAGNPVFALTTDDPDISDVSDRTAGPLLYRAYSGLYYRYLGAVTIAQDENAINYFAQFGDGKYVFNQFRGGAGDSRYGLIAVNEGASTTFLDVDVSKFIPGASLSREIQLMIRHVGGSSGALARLGENNAGATTSGLEINQMNIGPGGQTGSYSVKFYVDSNRIFEYLISAGAVDMHVQGYWWRR